MYVLRALGLIVALVGTIVFTVVYTRPIFSGRGKLGDELRKHAPGGLSPADSSKLERLLATPKFQQEKRNFYEDVMRLKQVDSARADSIAHYAIREAYIRGISPAIIFGVMLTENSRFISKARSNVGAVGLMQVYPKIWGTKTYTDKFGSDLATDSTNVKFGVFILATYFRPRDKKGVVRERDWQTALLRYNGCVRGTNTPRCHTYPNKVQSFVENQAKSICSGRGFYDCITKPFIEGLFGEGEAAHLTEAKPAAATTSATSAGEVAKPPPPPVTPTPTPTPAPTPRPTPSAPMSPMPKPRARAAKVATATATPSIASKKSATKSRKTPTAKKVATKAAPSASRATAKPARRIAPVKRVPSAKPKKKQKSSSPVAPKLPALKVVVP